MQLDSSVVQRLRGYPDLLAAYRRKPSLAEKLLKMAEARNMEDSKKCCHMKNVAG
jgi:hypothetical protein